MTVSIDSSSEKQFLSLVPDYKQIMSSTDGKWIVDQIVSAVHTTVAHVARIAALLRRAEELEIEIDIQVGPVGFLRRIAYGQMIPELYVAFEDDPKLMSKLSVLPTPDQKKIAAGKPLKVMTFDDNGNVTHLMVSVRDMSKSQVQQVFYKGRIRSEAEQVNYLRERLQAVKPIGVPIEDAYVVDQKKGMVVIRGIAFSSDDLLRMLAELGRKKKRSA
jgi:hypothetical protein